MAKTKRGLKVEDGGNQSAARVVGRVARGALERVWDAFGDLRNNRLSIPDNARLWNAQQVLVTKLKEREGIKETTIKQYDETGKGWEDASKAPPELVTKILELQNEVIEIDFGPSIAAENLKDAAMLPDNFAILKELHFIE